MIYVPKLKLNGNLETLRSRIKACRDPEGAWPEDILHEPIVVTRRENAAVVLLADPKEVARVLVKEAKNFPKWMPIYRHSAARETGSGTIFASSDENWGTLRKAIKPLFHSSQWALLVEVAQQATLDAMTTIGMNDIEAFFTGISVDVIYRTLVGDGPTDTPHYDLAGVARGLVHQQYNSDLHGAMKHFYDVAAACTVRGPGTVALQGVDFAGEFPPRTRPMQEPYLTDNRLALLYAGQETTALTLRWLFWILGQDQVLQDVLRQEVREAIDAEGLSTEAVGKMPRLISALRETMRLLSPSSATVRCARTDERLCGVDIPKSSVIVVPIYAIQRHRLLWDNPDQFDSDRFLSPIHHPMAFLPFAAGRHTCVASRSVIYEIAAVMSTLLGRFRWDTQAAEDMVLEIKLVLTSASEMNVRVETLGKDH